MSIKLIDDSKLTAIGAAIRTKGGTAALIDVDDMPAAIENLPSGGGGFDWSQCAGVCFEAGGVGLISGTPDMTGLDTSDFTTTAFMFRYCTGLTSLDLSVFDTSNVTTMESMFYYCTGLATIDLSGFDTSNVTTMESMFRYCSALTSLDLWKFDTPTLSRCGDMFGACSALKSINMSRFVTSNVIRMTGMFPGGSTLTDIIWSQKATVQPLKHTPSSTGITSQMKFYVPDALLNDYKAATNWSTIASQIYPISQLPAEVAALYAGHY